MSGDKSQTVQSAMDALQKINAVEGFDPTPLAVEYQDLNSGEKRLRLPVMALIGWFRLKYPEGRISNPVRVENNCFVCTARVYRHYSDPVEQFLGEATVSRQYQQDKPTVSPREWAQTAAIGTALRNAGFGLQFSAAGDAFDMPAADELGGVVWSGDPAEPTENGQTAQRVEVSAPTEESTVPSTGQAEESPLEKALKQPCPIAKYSGKTMGEVLQLDPNALVWVANKFSGDATLSKAAKLICEHAAAQFA